jgi:hypothetical protein
LWALPIAASLVLATSGCEVCTGDDCDFDEDAGDNNNGNNSNGNNDGNNGDADGGDDDAGDGEDGGMSDGGGTTGGPDVDVGEEIDLDGDGTADGKAIDTDDDGKTDGVDVDDDGKVDVPVPPASAPTLADFCDATVDVRRAWAAKMDDCCMSSMESGSDELQAILNLFGRDDGAEGCLMTYQALVRNGTLAFDGKKAKTCAEEYTELFPRPPSACLGNEGFEYWDLVGKVGKGVPFFAQMDSCRAALRGRLESGSPCTSHFECEGELRCLKMSASLNTCQTAIPSGGECNTTAECDADLVCAGTTGAGTAGRICIPKTDLLLAGGCNSSVECATGAYCDANKCTSVPDSITLTAAGDACTDSFACVGWCDTSGMKCAPLCAQ